MDSKIGRFFAMRSVQIGGAGLVVLLLIVGGLYFSGLFSLRYKLDESVIHLSQMIPSDVTWYVESEDPAMLTRLFLESRTGKNLLSVKALDRLQILPGFLEGGIPAYLLGNLGLEVNGFQGLLALTGGSSGFAVFPDASRLLVMKTNPAIDLAARLATTPLPPTETKQVEVVKKVEDTRAGERSDEEATAVGDADFAPIMEQSLTDSGGLSIRGFAIREKNYFLAELSGYIFVSDRRDRLEQGLALASQNGGDSLFAVSGMTEVASQLQGKRNSFLLYFAPNSPFFASLVSSLLRSGDSFAIVFSADETGLSGDFYEIGNSSIVPGTRFDEPARLSLLPADVPFAFHSSGWNLESFLQKNEADRSGGETASQLREFLKKSGLNANQMYGDRKGLSVVFHGFYKKNSYLYPSVSISGPFQTDTESLIRSVFRVNNGRPGENGVTEYPVSGGGFLPSRADLNDERFIASDRSALETALASGKGLIPDASDRASGKFTGEYKTAPIYLSIYLPALRDTLRDLLYYDAEKSPFYSQKTINTDLLPILDAFSPLIRIQFATGTKEVPAGKLNFQFAE